MIIFPDKIFILIPKCGCNSVMSSFGVNPWAKHRQHITNKNDAVLYLRGDYCHMPATQIPQRFKHLPTEAIVRNPWDRTVSRFFYLSKMNDFDMSFEEFVKTKYMQNTLEIVNLIDLISLILRLKHQILNCCLVCYLGM